MEQGAAMPQGAPPVPDQVPAPVLQYPADNGLPPPTTEGLGPAQMYMHPNAIAPGPAGPSGLAGMGEAPLGEMMGMGGEEDEDEDEEGVGASAEGPPRKKRGGHGRRKIEIEYIDDKIRRHITFSKRKAGISKKAYELSRLTGAQVLLLISSERGQIYSFATPKLQPILVNEGSKFLIEQCLNAPDPMAQQMPMTVPQLVEPTQGGQMMAPPHGMPPHMGGAHPADHMVGASALVSMPGQDAAAQQQMLHAAGAGSYVIGPDGQPMLVPTTAGMMPQ